MTVGETTDSTTADRPVGAGKADLAALADTTTRIRRAVESVIEGKRDVVRLALTVLLAEGHLLIEDVPGVGKTMLAKALARSIDCSVRRVQFTPDLLPSDITGVVDLQPGEARVRVQARRDLRQHRGRRRDQPGLAEDPVGAARVHGGAPGHRRRRRPTSSRCRSWCIATQNPIEMEGTYPLPEAQRDRFMARLSMGYPERAGRARDARHPRRSSPLDDLRAGRRRHRVAKHDRDRAQDPRLRPGTPLRRRPGHRDPQLPRPAARRVAARDPAPGPRRPRRGRARRPRLRAARRRPGPRGRRARPPAAAHRRGADRPARPPRTSWPTSWPRCRCPTSGPAGRPEASG